MPFESASEAAARILAERRDRTRFHALAPERRGDAEYAYAVQGELVSRLLASGQDSIAGWKIGLTTKRMQEFCGVDTPVAGAILRSGVHESGATVSTAQYCHLGIEAELAVHVARSFPQDVEANVKNVRGCLDVACAAFELVDDRDADYSVLDACSLIADNSWNAGIVLGEPFRIDGAASLLGHACELRSNGEFVGSGRTEDAGGDPLEGVAWLAAMLSRNGSALKQGQWVLTGSIVPTQFAQPDRTYIFSVGGLSTVRVHVV